MSALTVLSRLAFFMTPGIKPMAAMIIIAGAGLGPETGILVGFIATFASNFLFGQGLFTPWQMYSFALIGLLSGLLFYRKKISRLRAAVFGGISVLALYGPIMDVATVYIAMENPDTQAILSSLSVGLPFNLLHAGSTVIFLLLMYEPMIKKLHRVK
jgi:energy-coupling factor transport system substrate-specific component